MTLSYDVMSNNKDNYIYIYITYIPNINLKITFFFFKYLLEV